MQSPEIVESEASSVPDGTAEAEEPNKRRRITQRRYAASIYPSSRGRTRTYDKRINSPLLYRLSYAGINCSVKS